MAAAAVGGDHRARNPANSLGDILAEAVLFLLVCPKAWRAVIRLQVELHTLR